MYISEAARKVDEDRHCPKASLRRTKNPKGRVAEERRQSPCYKQEMESQDLTWTPEVALGRTVCFQRS